MSGITLRKVSKSFPEKGLLFEKIDFVLTAEKRVVLVGENGVGKTTLLRILAGVEKPDEGQIFFDELTPREYVTQDFDSQLSQTAYEFIEESYDFKRAINTLSSLGFDTSEDAGKLWLTLNKLSGGERKMLMLSRALSNPNANVILDEPENHLDIFSREKLISLLLRHRGGVVIVSHDHFLINQVSDQIIELENKSLHSFAGTYEDYLHHRETQIQSKEREWKSRDKEIKRLHLTVMRMRETAKVNSDTAKAYQAKKRQLEILKDMHGKRPTTERKEVSITIQSQELRNNKKMIVLENLSVGYKDKKLIQDINQEVIFGDKIALVGPNGCGKTTLLKTIMEDLHPLEGLSRLGINTRVVYFSQYGSIDLDQQSTPLKLMRNATSLSEGPSRSRLSQLLFESSDMTRQIKTLSGGQISRLRLGLIFAQNPDILILDEPTNHIDLTTWGVLVEALDEWTGTLLFSSHDRTFINAVADKLWVIENGTLEECLDELDVYLKKMDKSSQATPEKERKASRKKKG